MKLKYRKKILITGGSGFIGSCFAKFIKEKYKIYTLDKKNKNPFLKDKNITHIKCNICNYNSLNRILNIIKPEIVIHLAAQSTLDFITMKKKYYKKNNIVGTKNIVEITKKLNIEKFIFASTASVYKTKNKKLRENDKLLPNNVYGKTKKSNEDYIQKNFKNSKVKFCILRFFNVCSSYNNELGEFHNPETHLIPKVVNALSKNKLINIYGEKFNTEDGTCIRDYIHIRDILRGIEKSINFLNKNSSEIFNLGSGFGISVKEIINKSSKILNKKPSIQIRKRRKGDVDKLVCSITKAKEKLSWSPKFSKINKIINDEIDWQLHLKSNKLIRSFYK